MNAKQHLLELLTQHLPDRQNDDFLYHKQGSRYEPITFQGVYDSVQNLSYALEEEGVSFGDRVAILSNNRPEWVISDLAILSLGAITVPIYPTLSAKDTCFLLQHSDAKVVVVETQEMIDRVLAIQESCPNLKRIVFINPNIAAIPELCVPLSKLLKTGAQSRFKKKDAFTERLSKIKPDDLASIIYTSGTTGNPKGVMLTHRNFLSNIKDVVEAFSINQDDAVLSFLPLSHVFERTVGYYTLLGIGGKIYYARSIQTVTEDLQDAKPTVFISVPRLYEKVMAAILAKLSFVKKGLFMWALSVGRKTCLSQPWSDNVQYPFLFRLCQKVVFKKVADKLGGRIRFFVSGGAPLSKNVFEFFECMGFPVVEGYGLTESAPCIAGNRLDRVRKPGAVGQVLGSQEVKLAENGELLAKGPNIMKGYYKLSESETTALQDGWLHTGDIATIDDDGYIFIVDRLKEIIVLSNGKNVAPQPIETVLKENPYILQALLVGDNYNFISALIVPDLEAIAKVVDIAKTHARPEEWLTTPEARSFMTSQVQSVMAPFSQYEQIKKFHLVAKEFTQEAGELTPTLKYKRRVIIEKYAQEISALYR